MSGHGAEQPVPAPAPSVPCRPVLIIADAPVPEDVLLAALNAAVASVKGEVLFTRVCRRQREFFKFRVRGLAK